MDIGSNIFNILHIDINTNGAKTGKENIMLVCDKSLKVRQ